MTDADLPEVSELDAELFGPSRWNRATFASELRAPWRHYVVAEVCVAEACAGQHPPGAGAAGESPADAGESLAKGARLAGYAGIALGETAQVMTIGVNPAAQGQGIGRLLFTELLAQCEEYGCREVILEVRVDNAAAQGMYRDFGFAGIGVRKNYYQSEGIDALVMKKIFGPRIGPVGSEVTS